MREILFLAHRTPWPPDRGDRIRSWNVLRHLADIAPVHLFAFSDDGKDDPAPIDLASVHIERRGGKGLAMARSFVTGRPASLEMFDSPMMHRAVQTLLSQRQIGTIFAFSGQMAQFVPAYARARFLMDFVDVDSEKFRAYGRKSKGPLGWVYDREARLLGAYERAVARRAHASIFVSEAEADLFRKRGGQGAIMAIGNGIDLEYFQPRACPNDGLIVFTGQMDYPPNIEAVTHFANFIFPLVRARRPDVRFAIVGRNPTAAVRRLAGQSGVTVTGAVPDVRPWLADAQVVVTPLAIARGIQNKALEAMAMARPVVATPAAAEGIEAQNAMVVADLDQMAASILGLLADPARGEAIGRAARLRVEESYRWNERLAPLDRLLG